jgi:hypothetical protein
MTSLARAAASRLNGALSTGPKSAEGKAVVARNAVTHGIFAAVPVVAGECAKTWDEHRTGVLASLKPVGALEVNLAERVAITLWRLQRLSRYEAATIGTAVEDAGLPPPGVDPFVVSLDRCAANREEHLKWMRNEHRAARENLSVFAEAADLVRGIARGGPDARRGETVELVLNWASGLVYDRPLRKADPEKPSSPTFLATLDLPPGPLRAAPWTAALLLRVLMRYADAITQPLEAFQRELEEVLDDRAAAFAREVERLNSEIAGLRRRQETWRARAASAALLPPLDVLDRISKYEKHLNNMITSTLHELERLQARRSGEVVPVPLVTDVQVTVTHDHG